MAKLQTKKINIVDFSQESREDITKLARSLNPFFDDIERAFRKGLSVADNLPFEYITFTAEVDALGIPKRSIILSTGLTNIQGLCIIDAIAQDGISYPTATPFITRAANGSSITVKHIAGLPANKIFTIKIMVMS